MPVSVSTRRTRGPGRPWVASPHRTPANQTRPRERSQALFHGKRSRSRARCARLRSVAGDRHAVREVLGGPSLIVPERALELPGLSGHLEVCTVRSRQSGEVHVDDAPPGRAGVGDLPGAASDSSAQAQVAVGAGGKGMQAFTSELEQHRKTCAGIQRPSCERLSTRKSSHATVAKDAPRRFAGGRTGSSRPTHGLPGSRNRAARNPCSAAPSSCPSCTTTASECGPS